MMGSMIGTIIDVQTFLSRDKEGRIGFIDAEKTQTSTLFVLPKEREYIIPDFQREIRWKKENLVELIKDIESGSKFLGNIILVRAGDKKYFIIDGQQRITTILMLLDYVKTEFNNKIMDHIQQCKLVINNFSGFQEFKDNQYNLDNIEDEVVKEKIKESDFYGQIITYERLYKNIKKSNLLSDVETVRSFIKNLYNSTFNVILSLDTNNEYNTINYFLDVNLKGVKLDKEDIFKSYLFSMTSDSSVREEWINLKRNSYKHNEILKQINKLKKDAKATYPLMKMIEHYFYYDLYSDENYKNISFNEDFLLTNKIIDKKYKAKEHIIKVINNDTYMFNLLKNLNAILNLANMIAENQYCNQNIMKRYFVCTDSNMDNVEIEIIYSLLRSVLLDKKLILAKALIMKYIYSILLSNKKTKNNIRSIYTIFTVVVLFAIFEEKKEKATIIKLLKDFKISDAILYIKNLLDKKNSLNNKIIMQYMCTIDDSSICDERDPDDKKFRCKWLATIYNYFNIKNTGVFVNKGQYNDLKDFLYNNQMYSIEHFIVNDSDSFEFYYKPGTEHEKMLFEMKYPKEIKKYSQLIFNFLFIERDLNMKLKNYDFMKKITYIEQNIKEGQMKCAYSCEMLAVVKNNFKKLHEYSENENTKKEDIENYFENDFSSEYNLFVGEIVEKVIGKLQ